MILHKHTITKSYICALLLAWEMTSPFNTYRAHHSLCLPAIFHQTYSLYTLPFTFHSISHARMSFDLYSHSCLHTEGNSKSILPCVLSEHCLLGPSDKLLTHNWVTFFNSSFFKFTLKILLYSISPLPQPIDIGNQVFHSVKPIFLDWTYTFFS